jgi:hypothetical protein
VSNTHQFVSEPLFNLLKTNKNEFCHPECVPIFIG